MTAVRSNSTAAGASFPAAVASGAGPTGPVLEASALDKRYGGVHALRGANLRLGSAGSVHCLIGENGSGKSTLLGVLSGQVRPDAGSLALDGAPVTFSSPPEAVRAGIAMVSQETAVAEHLSIAENVLLGERLIRRHGRIDWSATRRRAAAVLERLNLDYDVTTPVKDLRPDQRQMVEIARAVSIDARVLILDEPTSFLSLDEVDRLFAAVRDLSANGVCTVFVSHRLPELFAIADEVTVLRDGRTVSSGPVADYTPDKIVHDMIGEAHEVEKPRPRPNADADTTPRLRIDGVTDEAGVVSVGLEVFPGEIVGVAGLAGSGRSELLELVFGARAMTGGSVEVDGRPIARPTPTASIKAGVGFVPAERKVDGVVLTMSVHDNLEMAHSGKEPWWRPPRRAGGGDDATEKVIADLRVKTDSPAALVGTLSGGNQQKVALGKWLVNEPTLLLLEEPTRGVDVRAKAEIHALLRNLAASGMGLLVSSSENEELVSLCDRILVMYRGEVVAALSSEQASEVELARLSGGTTL